MKKGSKMRPESVEKMRLTKIGRKMPPRTENHKRNIALAKLGVKNPMFGKHHTQDAKKRIRLKLKEITPKGEASRNWKGGFYAKEETMVRHTSDYKVWRITVYERDNYTCVLCNKKGGELNADHIKRFAEYPELRFELSNGRTLCIDCHRKTPTYGGNRVFCSRTSSSV